MAKLTKEQRSENSKKGWETRKANGTAKKTRTNSKTTNPNRRQETQRTNWLHWIIMGILILAVIGMIKAYNGEKWELPILSGAAKDFGDWLIKTFKI